MFFFLCNLHCKIFSLHSRYFCLSCFNVGLVEDELHNVVLSQFSAHNSKLTHCSVYIQDIGVAKKQVDILSDMTCSLHVHVTYNILFTMLRWWKNAVQTFKAALIDFGAQRQRKMSQPAEACPDFNWGGPRGALTYTRVARGIWQYVNWMCMPFTDKLKNSANSPFLSPLPMSTYIQRGRHHTNMIQSFHLLFFWECVLEKDGVDTNEGMAHLKIKSRYQVPTK